MLSGYFKMRRALREKVDDPKLRLGAKMLWLYPVGAAFALVAGAKALIDWMRVTQ